MFESEAKADHIYYNKNFRLVHNGPGILNFLVWLTGNSKAVNVFYDKRKKILSCECRGEVWGVECYHIKAIKKVLKNEMYVSKR